MAQKSLITKTVLLFLALTVTSGAIAKAAGPELMVYSGIIPQGVNQGDGYYDITFSLYGSQQGGSALWTETQSVYVYHGTFAVYLGAAERLNLAFDIPYWVGVRAGGREEIWPLTGAVYTASDNGAAATKDKAVEIKVTFRAVE